MPEPHVVGAPGTVYRVARRRGVLHYSRITPGDAALAAAGNRFDVAGGGVLYGATTPVACFAETLARFRPSPKIREIVKGEKDGFMVTGGVPADWRLQRVLASIELLDALPFLDVESATTHTYLSEALAGELVALGYEDEDLDFSDICGKDRRMTRAIAEHAYTATETDGSPSYSGIRYKSRINPKWECWAIFEGTRIDADARSTIELNDPAFQEVLDLWGLRGF